MMLSAGEHPMWVAKQMGHSDWTMIAREYGRWMPVMNDDAGGKAVSSFYVASSVTEAHITDRARHERCNGKIENS